MFLRRKRCEKAHNLIVTSKTRLKSTQHLFNKNSMEKIQQDDDQTVKSTQFLIWNKSTAIGAEK
ncbi:hypothetical protein B6D60_05620 [candidate division KSB1 bacterium 4484_87]|nr:MAG: hypothetical protein B6D60_05620 [candidate division KSB1 bacterium 4484_87]